MTRSHCSQIVGLIGALLLSGCASTSSVPEDHFYRLISIDPPVRFSNPTIQKPLIVARIKTFGIYHERAIVYAQADRPNTLRLHHYRHWIDKPTVLLQDHLASYLRALGIAETVLEGNGNQKQGIKLNLQLKRFDRRLSNDGEVQVHIAILVQAMNGKDPAPFLIREYSGTIPADDASMSATIRSFSAGLANIYGRLVEDLTGSLPNHGGSISESSQTVADFT